MSKRKRSLRTTIFIACEGRNTEPIYFEKIVEEIEDFGLFAVTIYPDRNDDDHVSHAMGLVEEARSRIDEFDELWVVFDKNGYAKHEETFAKANEPINGKRINIAFSSIAFEQWVLLHFLRSTKAFAKSADIIEVLRKEGYFPHYEKKAYIDTFSFLRGNTAHAIENAAWLRYELAKAGQLQNSPIYQLNPYTDVDTLVMRLLGIPGKWVWGSIGFPIPFGDVEFHILPMTQDILKVIVENLSGTTIVYNAFNVGAHFQFRAEPTELRYTLAETVTIPPGEQRFLTLTTTSPYTGAILECRSGNDRLFVAL